jgi:murein L,D-transpeptidase YafK
MLKQGHDHFEVTHLQPRIDVCERRYIFDAETTERFSPADRCPTYRVPDEIVAAVREKQRRDEIDTAELTNRGIPTMPVTTGADGGMHPTFEAAAR